MITALIALAGALVCWPSAPSYFVALAPARVAERPVRGQLNDAAPTIMAGAVFVLVAVWQSSSVGLLWAVVAAAGVAIMLRRARRAPVAFAPDPALPLALTVAALLLRSGAPPGAALAGAARGCRSAREILCQQVERRLRMGEPAPRAWSALAEDAELAAVGRAAIRASESGAALALAWEATAQRLRADRRLAAEVRARKVGVRVLGPLGLCFLPSFICLGVVPMVIGLAADIL